MKLSILRRRPSPALVISMIALFVSLSGVSYGVATGFIDSREIKNNEVRSIDIRNSTVQGRDIALSTVTGEDINESTLGKVPSATAADTAASAGGVSTLKLVPQTTLAEGVLPVTLATHGPLTLSATCEPGMAGTTNAGLTVDTTEDNSAAGAQPESIAPEPDLDAARPPFRIAVLNDDNPPAARSVTLTNAFASAPSGKAFTGQVVLYADAAGAGSCKFHGHLALEG